MPDTTRPLLAVRLIGPAETVAIQKRYLTAYLGEFFGAQVTVRSSTHSARRSGEIRAYVTVTLKETYDHTNVRVDALGD